MPEEQWHRHRHDANGRRQQGGLFRLVWANLLEIVGVGVIVLGVFLILERVNVRDTVARWAALGSRSALHLLGHLDESTGNLASRIGLSDVVGVVLVLAALVLIVYRLRWRLARRPSLTTLRCPRCGGSLHRVHRLSRDRLVSLVVPVRRYRCSRRECRWSGVRVVVSRQSQEAGTVLPPPPPAARNSAP
jgi:hypothetical protein